LELQLKGQLKRRYLLIIELLRGAM
jgi:hypothetical protein